MKERDICYGALWAESRYRNRGDGVADLQCRGTVYQRPIWHLHTLFRMPDSKQFLQRVDFDEKCFVSFLYRDRQKFLKLFR